MDHLYGTGRFTGITRENLAEFKRLAAQLAEVAAGEPDTLEYAWFFNADESQCVLREEYSSSDAVLAHFGNLGEDAGRLAGLADRFELEVFGEPSDALLAVIAPFKPSIYRRLPST